MDRPRLQKPGRFRAESPLLALYVPSKGLAIAGVVAGTFMRTFGTPVTVALSSSAVWDGGHVQSLDSPSGRPFATCGY